MKNYFIFLCVIFSCGLAKATTTTSVSQDKPDRLYVESYTDNESGEEIENDNCYDANGNPTGDEQGIIWSKDDRTGTYTVNWSDGSTGTAHWHWHDVGSDNFGGGTLDTVADTFWPTSSWPNISVGTVTETGYGSDDYDEHVGSPIIWEHCDTGVPLVDETGVYLWPPGTWDDTAYLMNLNQKATRHAQAKIKLQTGGKSGSRLHNLFGFTASATHIVGVKDPPPFNENNFVQNVSVPQQNIVLGSVGTMPATGTLYKILPDDTTVDVTPTVSGMDYYTFNVSESKYHSYYDLYDEQANPGYSFMPYGTNEVGHAFWQFSTEAPSDALQYISTNLTKYLGTSCGFFPSNGLFTLPGQMEFGGANGSANIHRRFYIGFPDLINGLEFTKDTTLTPPDYVLTAFNCVGAARGAGFAADVFALPWDESPQNFGVTLVQMYPGPFDDETDIFYSTAPY